MKLLAALLLIVSMVTFVIALIGGYLLTNIFQHTPAGWLKLTNTLIFFAMAFLLYHIASAKE